MLAELAAAVRDYGQLLEAESTSAEHAEFASEPITERLEDHLAEAGRQQDRLTDLLRTDPAEQPEGWPLRGEILAHVDRLRSELQPGALPGHAQAQARVRQPLRALREQPLRAPLRVLRRQRLRARRERRIHRAPR
jgi:hypothetical protein